MVMTTNELRQAFIDYFVKNKHQHLKSASLVPDDQSLLFTNAGMVPFKPYFLGNEVPKWKRVTSSQRCVRAGGKHNDLENVGVTARHHTFFEMLGNFSFGDYFKSEAIHYAWDFIINVCQLDPAKLWITVYKDDEESAQIWHNQEGVPTDRIIYCGEASNFWSMGNTGPCGPCTEIFYDHGPEIPGGPPGSKDEDGDRFVEIWNLVFMQYNQDDKGERKLLPAPCVDTGMGLERIAAVVQGVHDNYDTDQFVNLIDAINQLPGSRQLRPVSSRVIADHIRSIVFLIADGVLPSNEGRGYVLRRIMRRALCFAYRDGMPLPFLHILGQFVCREMSTILPEGKLSAKDITSIILNEEKQFDHVIGQGMVYLESYIAKGNKRITGEQAFKLYDTYGFPLDLTLDIAKSQEIEVDEEGFEQCMQQQRNRSRSSQAFEDSQVGLDCSEKTNFIGYDKLTYEAKILYLFDSARKKSTSIADKDQCYLVLDQSVFYPEGGGQVADQGELEAEGVRFKVEDVQKQGDSIILFGTVLEGELTVNMNVTAKVNSGIRKATMLNHSATHLLHAALREVLGHQVEQKGSLVNDEYLRFDYSYDQGISQEQIKVIERLVRFHIRSSHTVQVEQMTLEEAKAKGAMALFEDKYQGKVRVLSMGDFSIELCGGTHVKTTGEIGSFKIINETSIASGIRRIVALTGDVCDVWVDQRLKYLDQAANSLHVPVEYLGEKIDQLKSNLKSQEASINTFKQKMAVNQAHELLDHITTVEGKDILVLKLDNYDLEKLRVLADQLIQGYQKDLIVVIVAPQENNKNLIIVAVSKSLMNLFSARDILKAVTKLTGGGGGGRSDFAQGAGPNNPELTLLKDLVVGWVKHQLENSH